MKCTFSLRVWETEELEELTRGDHRHGHKAQALNRLATHGAETARRARRDMQAACQMGRRASDFEGRNLKNVPLP